MTPTSIIHGNRGHDFGGLLFFVIQQQKNEKKTMSYLSPISICSGYEKLNRGSGTCVVLVSLTEGGTYKQSEVQPSNFTVGCD